MALSDDEKAFGRAITQVYQRAKTEAGYTATRFAQMLGEHGGLKTAKLLLHSSAVSDGFSALWEADRLDLTVEYQVLRPEFQSLFTDDELETARQRLLDYGLAQHSVPRAEPSTAAVTAGEVPNAYTDAIRLMDSLAAELGLKIEDTDASRKYRLGTRGPSAWIHPRQAKMHFDLRTFRRANPSGSSEQVQRSLQALSSLPVSSDMAAIPLTDAVARWDVLASQVIRPFFAASSGGDSHETARPWKAWSSTRSARRPMPVIESREPPPLMEDMPETILLEISKRRNAIEARLRQILSQGLRYEHGGKAAAVLLGCLSDGRKSALVGTAYDAMWQALYFNELREVVNKEWRAFSGWFGQDKDRVLGWLEHVNRFRVDAHAKSISDEDLAYLRVCFKRLEEAVDL